ncbi:hypothetical protein BCU68_12475 [Vibrio sp. 10N.286.49.B3]|uniref:hypothetical protein n=1 Tax=Vibrio sp. 10N.286.49.B3 TaxID=1880855 RepID=UPI000C8415C8|nr:hypothetical protein [Vibrio sp. 10N.286.49.B3]PMH44656.1 hypothetical protein BCU68_12475 [Vibrio sp. 10N.286.49.B3]
MHEVYESSISASKSSELKKNVIATIKSNEYAPELIMNTIQEVFKKTPDIFECYKVNDSVEEIINIQEEWVLPGYFDKHCRFLEQNFSQERVEHLIKVKSHLIEFGVLGFSSSSVQYDNDCQQEEMNMNNPFSQVNISGFKPTPSFQKSLSSGDVTQIRMALFMEMNDHRLSTQNIKQTIAYTIKSKPNLFVSYEQNCYAKEMSNNKASWDAKYYAFQEVYASSNFSHERIQHMLDVRESVFSIPKVDVNRVKPQPAQQHPKAASRTKKTKHTENDNLKALAVLGGAIAAIAIIILALV